MNTTIKGLLKISTFQSFRLVAGEKGLDRQVGAAGILDFEFVEGLGEARPAVFARNSFVISSLLFAKNDKELLITVMKRLIEYGIAGFAYKTVFYKELPQEILDLAEENQIPFFSFGDEVYFEEIIYRIIGEVQAWSGLQAVQEQVRRLMEEELAGGEIRDLTTEINPQLKQYFGAVLFSSREYKSSEIVKNCVMDDRLKSKVILAPYQGDVAVVLSRSEQGDLKALLLDVLEACGLDETSLTIGYSSTYSEKEALARALKEARCAKIVASIEHKREVKYPQIGQYQILIQEIKRESLQSYMEQYLKPISGAKQENRELMKTAVQYILAKGDMEQAAERLFCHKNTIRYRVNKLHQLLDEASETNTFYENLATAVKIYLINDYLKY